MTSRKKSEPIAQAAYDELAEEYAARIDTKPHNAYYERPAMLSLLPAVQGKRVLDAGCGPGVYAEWLVAHGAEVIAFDGNRKMVRLAKRRLGDKVQVLLANLEQPLHFLGDSSMDIIVCPLTMDYVQNWEPTFTEYYRVLKYGGCLIFSMEHPYTNFDDHRATSNYFDVELVEYIWRGFGKPVVVPSYRRPLSAVVNLLIQVGFTLDHILEPLPTPEFKSQDPEEYEQLLRSPGFMVVKALKQG